MSEPSDEAAEPRPRKKKRKKRKPAEDAPPPAAVASRPSFAQAFPSDAELDRLLASFEAGDYRAVRSGGRALVHATKRDEVRRAARELLRRIEPDRTAALLLGVAVALLAYLSWWHWSHPHGVAG